MDTLVAAGKRFVRSGDTLEDFEYRIKVWHPVVGAKIANINLEVFFEYTSWTYDEQMSM